MHRVGSKLASPKICRRNRALFNILECPGSRHFTSEALATTETAKDSISSLIITIPAQEKKKKSKRNHNAGSQIELLKNSQGALDASQRRSDAVISMLEPLAKMKSKGKDNFSYWGPGGTGGAIRFFLQVVN